MRKLVHAAPVRKAYAFLRQIPRAAVRMSSSALQYETRPPILANSFPKSGTHLLVQILEAFPGMRDYGSFIASTPSVTFRERSEARHLALINRMVPGELVRAHLHHGSSYADALEGLNAAHFFICRDLRDVVVSEAHYLTYMNRWHRLHATYRRLPDMAARVLFCITGGSAEGRPYPNVGARFARYRGWLEGAGVEVVHFEDLVGEHAPKAISRMVSTFAMRAGFADQQGEVTEAALARIDPRRSHTFRSGQVGGWQKHFTDQHRSAMKDVAGDLLVELGYAAHRDW